MAPTRPAALATALTVFGLSSALRLAPRPASSDLSSYSFEQFMEDFGREYTAASDEYELRRSNFQASLVQVNSQNQRQGRSWTAGVHDFMDWTIDEREAINGYRPVARNGRSGGSLFASLQTDEGSSAASNATATALLQFGDSGGLDNPSPDIRNQGHCGSCWAVSAVEAVEAQLLKQGLPRVQLSPQALVDCAPNPQHCGGTGGCHGATGALAFEFIRDHGIPLESELPYDAQTEECPVSLDGAWPAAKHRVRLSGFTHLESNKAQPLMDSLVNSGPTIVAVDAHPWHNYAGGIFDGCDNDAMIGHAVLAKGYGTENGKKYWLIQNSWGAQWGERGHIRLERQDDGGESHCGTDRKPQEGEGCDGGPSEVTVCGTCGILYDPVFPEGARIESVNGNSDDEVSDLMPSPSSAEGIVSSWNAPKAAAADALGGWPVGGDDLATPSASAAAAVPAALASPTDSSGGWPVGGGDVAEPTVSATPTTADSASSPTDSFAGWPNGDVNVGDPATKTTPPASANSASSTDSLAGWPVGDDNAGTAEAASMHAALSVGGEPAETSSSTEKSPTDNMRAILGLSPTH